MMYHCSRLFSFSIVCNEILRTIPIFNSSNVFIFLQAKFASQQQDADNVSVRSLDVSTSSKKEPEADPNNEEVDETEEKISKRTKSISEQLSKVEIIYSLFQKKSYFECPHVKHT